MIGRRYQKPGEYMPAHQAARELRARFLAHGYPFRSPLVPAHTLALLPTYRKLSKLHEDLARRMGWGKPRRWRPDGRGDLQYAFVCGKWMLVMLEDLKPWPSPQARHRPKLMGHSWASVEVAIDGVKLAGVQSIDWKSR